ncbi:hypothetical protein [Streptomyces sp. SID3343]|uniref:EamA family transporter n=1 Tax=Streptomyces sp. SID3343 TaxID=2690260 RepID=UPI001368AD97|nr:hypothetical protein [Streptomyces sp. SID3343]MYW01355.1 hypothetical protein [Streptomyces sp. SID3343]
MTTEGADYGRGVASLGLASMLGAAVNVAFGNIAQTVNPFVLTLFMVGVSSIVFGVANRGRRPILNPAAWRAVIGLNVASAGVYIFLVVGLKYLEPAVGTALQAGATPLMTIVVTGFVAQRRAAGISQWAGGTVVLAGSGLLVWVSCTGHSGLGTVDSRSTAIGIGAVLVSGLSTVFLTLCAKRLIQIGWRDSAVLAHRFYFTIVCCAALSIGVRADWSAAADRSGYLILFSVLGSGVVLLLQIGIRKVAPFVVLAMTNLNPLITYTIQLFDHRLSTSLDTLYGIAVILTGLAWIILTQRRTTHPAPAAAVSTPTSSR